MDRVEWGIAALNYYVQQEQVTPTAISLCQLEQWAFMPGFLESASGAKARRFLIIFGTTKVVPCYKTGFPPCREMRLIDRH